MAPEENKETKNNQEKPEVAEGGEVEALKKALAEEKAKAEANLAGWKRAQADFINYKRRTEQEKEELTKSANAGLMFSLLPVLDDLERALDSTPPELAQAGWVDGTKLIGRKLKATLEAQGLSRIEAVGKSFDPNLHEAVGQVKGKEGIVVQELQKGYKLHNKLLRPATVLVGNGEEATEEKEA